jgi:hypothetical protein
MPAKGRTITIPANISGVSYLLAGWIHGDEFIVSSSGIIILNVSNLCGTDSDTIEVDISGVAPDPHLGPDTMLCEGQYHFAYGYS